MKPPLLTLTLAALSALLSSPWPARAAEEEPKRILTEADSRLGKPIYLRECQACHGERGEGDGPAAKFLDPLPRNFTKKMFKLRTTPTGVAPSSADVQATIERGIPGSAMPSFRFLGADERRQVAAYVLNFADMLDGAEPRSIPDPGSPPPTTPESVAKGKEIYAAMQCRACHGTGGKGDGPASRTMQDDDGRPVVVRDFTAGVFRGGAERKDLYYRFTTGMDGSPMPSFGDSVTADDRWALVDFVKSLEHKPEAKPLSTDPLKAGREIAAKYSCRGCHKLDDGKGGDVGPDLRLSGQKLDSGWVAGFVQAPREKGKLYPWRPARMPHLGLSPDEGAAVASYLAAMGKRKPGPVTVPDDAALAKADLNAGKNLFVLRCTECHTLGKVIETPLAKQQGPDLINVWGRVDYAWSKRWIADPKKIDPKTKMTTPGLTAEQVDAVRAFVWKESREAARAGAGSGP